MASFALDGTMCPAWFGLTGNPLRVAYLYDTPEGQNDREIKVSDSVILVPEDDGASWSGTNFPRERGATFVLTIPDVEGYYTPEQLQSIEDRLVRAKDNQIRAYNEMLAMANAPIDPNGSVVGAAYEGSNASPAPAWQRLGYKNEAKWIKDGSPE